MEKITIPIKGMHCASCETLIEKEIKTISGVKKVNAKFRKNEVIVLSDRQLPVEQLEAAIEKAGYSAEIEGRPFFTRNIQVYLDIILAFVVFAILYEVIKLAGISDLAAKVGSPSSLGVVGLVGLTAGFSTCMALVGGLLLGVSAKYAEKHPDSTPLQKFRPHLYFNFGRIMSYFLLGGLIGQLGSVIQFSPKMMGFLVLVVGLAMLFMGLQLTEVSPVIEKTKITLPKSLARLLKIDQKSEKEYSHTNSLILGALTFFLPCGFTQAMQLYAISQGSFWGGALIMGVFAIGTTPGLLTVGGLTSVLTGNFAKRAFRFVGVVIVLFALFNLSNGYRLSGLSSFAKDISQKSGTRQSQETGGTKAVTVDGAQVIKGTYTARNGLQPQSYEVKAGTPVNFQIEAKDNGVGCMGSVVLPDFSGSPKFFEKGETVSFNFTPTEPGTYQITCAMGISAGKIIVN